MKAVFLSLVIGAALISPAAAAPRNSTTSDGPDSFSGHFGLAIPLTGDLQDVADTGFQLGGQWIHAVRSDLGFGLGLDYISYGDKSEHGVNVNVDQWSILGLVQKHLSYSRNNFPYLLGGLGLAQTNLDADAGFASASDDDMGITFMFGGGVDYPLDNGLSIGFSGRYQQFLFDIGNVDGGGALQLLGELRW
jgi:opacity protein-like surface antigen